MKRLAEFMARIATETYPEPRTAGHDKITGMMAPLVAKLLLKPHALVLDVGCGQGNAMEWFQQNRRDIGVVGITTNETDLRECTSRHLNVYQHDMNNMPGWISLFDLVWARHVLEHSVAPYWTLHEFQRVLKPAGILYLEVPAPETASHHEANQNHYSVLGKQMWLQLLDRAGFDLLEARRLEMMTCVGPDVYFSFICKKKGGSRN